MLSVLASLFAGSKRARKARGEEVSNKKAKSKEFIESQDEEEGEGHGAEGDEQVGQKEVSQ
jgi:hypothetical protein